MAVAILTKYESQLQLIEKISTVTEGNIQLLSCQCILHTTHQEVGSKAILGEEKNSIGDRDFVYPSWYQIKVVMET